MQSESYQILIIGEDPSRTQAFAQMLHEAEEASFEVVKETNWQSALERFALGAPDLPLPDAVLWELPSSGSAALALLKESASPLWSVPFVVLVPEDQKPLGKQMLQAGASEYLIKETLNKALLQRSLRYAIERNRAENSIRRWEKRFEDLFENTKDILFTMDLEGNVTSVNKAAEEVMGWPRNEALQMNIKSLVAPEHGEGQLLANRGGGDQALQRSGVHHRALPNRNHEVAVGQTRLGGRRLLEHLHDEHPEAFAEAVLLGDLFHLLLGEIADPHSQPSPRGRPHRPRRSPHRSEDEQRGKKQPADHRSPVSWV